MEERQTVTSSCGENGVY